MIKTSWTHNYVVGTGSAYQPPNLPVVVFQHIPRTSGDSMMYSLFWDKENLFRMDGLPKSYTPLREQQSPETLRSYRILKGFFGAEDMDYIRESANRSTKAFTILRHPVERCLSYRDWWVDKSPDWRQMILNQSVAEFFQAPGYERRAWYCFNGMVRQLGRGLSETWDSYATLSLANRSALLEAAKQRLKQLDLVAFYENMNWDFIRLRHEIFAETEVHWSYRVLYQLGTWFGLSRLKILKYTASAEPADLAYLRSMLDLTWSSGTGRGQNLLTSLTHGCTTASRHFSSVICPTGYP